MNMRPLAPKGRLFPSEAQGGIPRVTRLSEACEKCRSLRKRCDGAKPCSSCRDLHIQCQYSGSDGRKKQVWKARVDALEERNHYLEQQIERLKCHQAAGQETSQQKLLLADPSSTSAESRLTSSSTSAEYRIEHVFYTATATHPVIGSSDILYGVYGRNGRDQLPDERITRLALDAFFQCAATLFYVTNEANMTQLLKKVYRTEDASMQDLCELSALAAIGSYYIPNQVSEDERARYFFLASTNLSEAIQPSRIQGLRVFICLCMSCIMDKSLTARLLVMAGLNLARAPMEVETQSTDPNMNDANEYRRTLQTLIFLEGWLSYSLGYRNCLKESELEVVRVNVPLKDDFMDNKAFITCLIRFHITKLAVIVSEIQNDMILCQQDYWSHADPLSLKLDVWYQELPVDLQLAAPSELGEEQRVTITQKRGIYMMHMLYIDSRLQLFCQLLNASQGLHSGSDQFCVETLFKGVPQDFYMMNVGFAIQLARTISLLFTDQAIMTRCWLVIRSAFDACVVLLLGLCHQYSMVSEDLDLSDTLCHMDTCFRVLCSCGIHDIAAKRLCELINPVYEQFNHTSLSPTLGSEPGPHLEQSSATEITTIANQQLSYSTASETSTPAGMACQLLKFMPPYKWNIWI